MMLHQVGLDDVLGAFQLYDSMNCDTINCGHAEPASLREVWGSAVPSVGLPPVLFSSDLQVRATINYLLPLLEVNQKWLQTADQRKMKLGESLQRGLVTSLNFSKAYRPPQVKWLCHHWGILSLQIASPART